MQKCRESIAETVYSVLESSGTSVEDLNEYGLADAFKETTFEKAFSFFKSQKNIEKFVSDECNFVEPVEYVLGNDNRNGKEHTMQYIENIESIVKI